MRYAASIIITTMVLLGCQQDRSMEPIDVNDPVDQILVRFIQASGGARSNCAGHNPHCEGCMSSK